MKSETKLTIEEKARRYDQLPKYVTICDPNGKLIAYYDIGDDSMIVSGGLIFTENYGESKPHFFKINNDVYYFGALKLLDIDDIKQMAYEE